MKTYRDKKRAQHEEDSKLVNPKVDGGKKAARKVSKRKNAKVQWEKQKLMDTKKQNTVLRTQAWRLRVKLAATSNMVCEDQAMSEVFPFSSYSAERRTIDRVTQLLPQTPTKRAKVIESISKSLTTSKILARKGLLMSPENRKSLKVVRKLIESIRSKTRKTAGTAENPAANKFSFVTSR